MSLFWTLASASFFSSLLASSGGVAYADRWDHDDDDDWSGRRHGRINGTEAIELITSRRIDVIISSLSVDNTTAFTSWLSTLGADGKWPDSDINYATGCDAQRANWPAQKHWSRIETLAGVWHGGVENGPPELAKDANLREKVSLAMSWWFNNDYNIPGCIDGNGTDPCPCGTPGMWNTNWFPNVIGIPEYVGRTCLLLNDTLSADELTKCTSFTNRGYNTFYTGIKGVSNITGANAIDIASIGIDGGLLSHNTTLLEEAFARVHNEVRVFNGTKVDGIRADGSFGQHSGIIYNGNYGKDFSNAVLNFEIEALGTVYEAPPESKRAFEIFWKGNQWMIYRNIRTGILHWDFSVLGRMLIWPTADDQATADIKTNITQLAILANRWDSDALSDVVDNLRDKDSHSANNGDMEGNRMFYANDYMVQRGDGYVTTLRMYSSRTQNTECTNSQNLMGFHLSDGAVYNHLTGDEYEDITAAWDWNMIPGITVDYGTTELTCSKTRRTGTQAFVGGASNHQVGVAAMRYQNPLTGSLSWQKAWFFLEDNIQLVMVAGINSSTAAPVYSVLDQRKHVGDVFVDNVRQGSGNYSNATSLWHAGVGYTFNNTGVASLSLDVSNRTGNWSSIGTSTQPPVTVDMFTAWLSHTDTSAPISYMVYPGVSRSDFRSCVRDNKVIIIQNDVSISAILDKNEKMAYIVFWDTQGGQVTISGRRRNLTVQSSGNANVILDLDNELVTVSDPSQTLSTLNLTLTANWDSPQGLDRSWNRTVNFELPSGGLAGRSETRSIRRDSSWHKRNKNWHYARRSF